MAMSLVLASTTRMPQPSLRAVHLKKTPHRTHTHLLEIEQAAMCGAGHVDLLGLCQPWWLGRLFLHPTQRLRATLQQSHSQGQGCCVLFSDVRLTSKAEMKIMRRTRATRRMNTDVMTKRTPPRQHPNPMVMAMLRRHITKGTQRQQRVQQQQQQQRRRVRQRQTLQPLKRQLRKQPQQTLALSIQLKLSE